MDKKYFYVFSYGSNLLFERIQERIQTVQVVMKHQLTGYRLIFNKASEDGSVKANIEETGNPQDSVWGVIHMLNYAEKPILDRHETLGHGYQLICFRLQINGGTETIHTYISNEDRFTKIGKPYNWYLNYMIAGAKQNRFPTTYISNLISVKSEKDWNDSRINRNREILQKATTNPISD